MFDSYRLLSRSAFVIALFLALGRAGEAYAVNSATPYTIEVLGNWYPHAINNTGQVAGVSFSGSTAVYHNDNTSTTTFFNQPGNSRLWDINDNGLASGNWIGSPTFGFTWDGVTVTPVSPPGTNGFGINIHGQVAGDRISNTNGTSTELGSLGGGATFARAINDQGQAAGRSRDAQGDDRAFFWDGSTLTPLDSTPDVESEAWDLNESGQVVGYVQNKFSPLRTPTRWDNGVPTTLLAPGTGPGTSGEPFAINASGQIVGYYQGDATIWINDEPVDLETLVVDFTGWDRLQDAQDINDQGVIVGRGEFNGQTVGFRLTPVPEPSSAVFLSLAGLLAARRRR